MVLYIFYEIINSSTWDPEWEADLSIYSVVQGFWGVSPFGFSFCVFIWGSFEGEVCNPILVFPGFQILPLKMHYQKGFWKIEKGKPR